VTADPHPERLLPANSIGEAFELNGVLRHYRRDSQIYGEAEAAEFFYQLTSGAVRTCKTLRDGRRQVGAFYLAGDVFGLEAGLIHTLNAECLVPSTLRIVRRGTVLAMASHDPSLATDLWMRTAEGLQRAHEHMLLLGRTTAEERVVGFLLHMAARNPNQPEVDLPMTRRDIADYLGLAIETVSRTLTSLVRCAAIHRSSHRRFGLRSRAALDRVATGGHSRGDSAPLGRKPVSDIVDPPARAWTA